jgi:hypothetical protein
MDVSDSGSNSGVPYRLSTLYYCIHIISSCTYTYTNKGMSEVVEKVSSSWGVLADVAE